MKNKKLKKIIATERTYHKANLELFGREMKKQIDDLQNNLQLKNERIMDLGNKLRMTQEKLKSRVKDLEELYDKYNQQNIKLKKAKEMLDIQNKTE